MPLQAPSIGESEQPYQNVETQNPLLHTAPSEHSRSYQMEMYEASMKGNIIVVVRLYMGLHNEPLQPMRKMDTGSGKTHVYGVILHFSRTCKQSLCTYVRQCHSSN